MKYLLILLTLTLNAQIEGRVIDKQSYWYENNIYTDNTIDTSNGTLKIKTYGGVVGLEAETVSDTPQLYLGQRGVFYETNGFLDRVEQVQETAIVSATVTPSEVTAGTGQTVTITGTGFGAQNNVSFPWSNAGGVLLNVEDRHILSWTDTEIVLEVPDWAGTGALRVRTLENGNIDTNVLTIPYAILNFTYDFGTGEQDYRPYPVNDDLQGGYTFNLSTSLGETETEIVNYIVDEWRCKTGVNWKIGETIDSQTIADDGVNIVTYSQTGTIPTTILGRCTTRYSGCTVDGSVIWRIKEIDILWNIDLLWDLTDNNGAGFHFKTVGLHEFGHAHGQAHIIDTNKVMHYAASASAFKITIGQSDIDGGMDYIGYSESVCGYGALEPFSCETLGLEDFDLDLKKKYVYYNLLGQLCKDKPKGIYIRVTVYENGHIESKLDYNP